MKQDDPIVSVCVQTYQHVNYIEQCLDNIISQVTDFRYEIILGEDESTDGTREICLRYAEKYPQLIRLFLRKRIDVIEINGKKTGRYNFQENLKAAKGKYIALCEGDDYWTDNLKLQKQVNFLESHVDYSLCFHKVSILKDSIFIDDYITKAPSQTTTISDLAKGNYIHTPSVMFRGGLVLPLWFEKVLAGDYALHLLNAERGKIYCIEEIMAVYRIHSGGIWSTNSEEENQLKWLSVLTTLCDHMNGEVKDILSRQRLSWAMQLFKKGYMNETDEIVKNDVKEIIQMNSALTEEKNHLLTDPTYLSKKVSGTFLLKAVINKLKSRFGL